MKKIALPILILALLTIGYVSYTKLILGKPHSALTADIPIISDIFPPETQSLVDPACDVSKYDSYLDAGFGVINVSEGFLKNDKLIKAIQSCDYKKITITGSVKQDIVAPDLNILTDGTNFPVLDEDYNFDGYNDISTMYSEGQGSMAIYSSYYFLFDPVQNKYVYNDMLSEMENLGIKSTTTKMLYQYFGLGPDQGYNEIIWKWKGSDLVKISDTVKKYDME